MGTQLHQALRTLCYSPEWRYAVFWKLRHLAPMMLTLEDAHYDNHEPYGLPDNVCFAEMGGNLRDRHSHDPLGLAVMKMSYHVYSLGEGVIGQVAVSGKHMWLFADKHVNDSCSSFEHSDGWKAQFSAGIKTVVVVAVVPHGVLQLGSSNKIPEDLKMVNYIRDAFFALQDSSVGPKELHCNMRSSSSLSDTSTRSLASGIFPDCSSSLSRPVNKDKTLIRAPTFPSTEKLADHSHIVPVPGDLPKRTADVVNKGGGRELSAFWGDESGFLLQPRSEVFLLEKQADILHSDACDNQMAILCTPEPFGMQFQREMEKNIELQTEINKMEPWDMAFKFSAGCELYDVVGPAYQKQSSYGDWEAEKAETETAIEVPEGMDCSSLSTEASGSEHLLEAVVAAVCRGVTDLKSKKSFCESVRSQLTSEEMPQLTCDKLGVGSAGYSFDQSFMEKEALHCLSSEACGVSSSKGFSSRSHSAFGEQLAGAKDPAKVNKKRARPGESCRPRPRDRQLIQDRIKELRELVPNGSKCNIVSLLERTIKLMLFMQSITKHAEKLNKCTRSKLHDKETVGRGLSRYDQGSTWAVEVGNQVKVCPIMVENINMNGQMLIEMLCEECGHFLDIAEAIRSLGLTILKGVTEPCGNKTLIRFMVEGQNNRSMHRMDILWSVVQILQSKAII